jgi:hypothetical protein
MKSEIDVKIISIQFGDQCRNLLNDIEIEAERLKLKLIRLTKSSKLLSLNQYFEI